MSVTFQDRRFFQNAVLTRSQINKIDKSMEEIERKISASYKT